VARAAEALQEALDTIGSCQVRNWPGATRPRRILFLLPSACPRRPRQRYTRGVPEYNPCAPFLLPLQAQMDAALFQSGCCDMLPLAAAPSAPLAFAHPAQASTLASVLEAMGATHRKLGACLTWDAPGVPPGVPPPAEKGVSLQAQVSRGGGGEAHPWCIPGWAPVEAQLSALSAAGAAFKTELGPWLGLGEKPSETVPGASLGPDDGERGEGRGGRGGGCVLGRV